MIIEGALIYWFIIYLLFILLIGFIFHYKFIQDGHKIEIITICTAIIICLSILSSYMDAHFGIQLKTYKEYSLQMPIKEMQIFNQKLMVGIGDKDGIPVYYYLEDTDRTAINYMPVQGVVIYHTDNMRPGIYTRVNKHIVQGIFKYTTSDNKQEIIVIPNGVDVIQIPDI